VKHQDPATTDRAPASESQAVAADAVARPVGANGKGNGHDEQPRSGTQEAAEGLDSQSRRQVALGVNGARGAPAGPGEALDPDGSSGVDINDDDHAGVTELSEDAFNAQPEAQSARNAKAMLEIDAEEFARAPTRSKSNCW
jgi:hypothetical protein